MKNNKKVILFITVILIAIISVVSIVLFSKKDEPKEFIVSGDNNLVASLEANSQSEVDELIKSDLEHNSYDLKHAKVYLNPYGGSPLSAMIVFKTESSTSVKVTVKGKHNNDITMEYDSGVYHYIPVFALYSNYENKVEVSLGDGTKETITIPIGVLEYAPAVNANTSNVTEGENGLYFITSPINMHSFAVDAYGEIRWYSDAEFFHNIVPLENGHILIGTSAINNDGLSTQLMEIDYIGRVYKTYNIEEGYLNDFFVKKDGNILLASKNPERKTFSEYIIEIDKNTGKIVKTFDVFKLLEEVDQLFVNEIDRDDYFYNSGIEYNEDSDSLLLTYWGGEFVINLSYKNNSIKWIFSNPKNFSSLFDNLLLKGGENFAYPKAMHSATLEGNTLKVFDNGFSTNANDTNSSNLVGSYSSANTYTINGKNISLDSSIDEDKKRFSYALGDYEIVKPNEELVLFGREFVDLDYSKGVDINEYDKFVSRLIEKKDGVTTTDIEIGWATYSVVKSDLNGKYSCNFEPLMSYTTLEPTPRENITDEIINMLNNDIEKINYEFGYSNGIIEHNVLFMNNDEAKLILLKENKEGTMYTLKNKGESRSEKIVTDLEVGKYYVYILENGVMYKTDSFIEIK